MKRNPENMRGALIDINAEFMLLRALTKAMFDQCPNQARVLRDFRSGVESYVQDAPAGIGADTLAELRARAEFYLAELAASVKRTRPRRRAS